MKGGGMDNRKIGNILAVIALIFFVVAIIGNAVGGSHRWVEAFENAGWIFFVGTILVLYLMAGEPSEGDEAYARWSPIAWAFGGLAIALFLFALIIQASTVLERSWYEAVELAGVLSMLVTIVTAIMARGGWRARPTDTKD
jgi:hypothetical protein